IQLFMSTRDQHTMSRFLRSQFPGAQVFEQSILNGEWVRRIFQLGSPEIDDWASRHMQPLTVPSQPSVVEYERAALLPPLMPGDGPTVALLWHFRSEPTDPFFSDVVLLRGETEVDRQTHVAYPTAFWETGDWKTIR